MIDVQLRKQMDWPLLLLTYLIAAFGVLILFSATHGDASAYHKKQVVGVVLGTVGLVAMTLFDYHLFSRFAAHLYWFNLVCLLVVSKFGHSSHGAVRWIRIAGIQYQPSEFAKLFVILTLGVFLAARIEKIREVKTLGLSLLYVSVPAYLILKQPDLGTALVIFAIWFGMTFMAGARLRHLAGFMALGVVVFALYWHSGKMKDYQKDRLIAVLHQEENAAGAGYHVMQARIAIGSGGVWGKGLLHGTQVHGGYIPEKQTDFIFTDIGEELGFVGTVGVVIAYGLLLWRGAGVISSSYEDPLGKLFASGIVTMLGFHIIVNIGMNIGIMPVAGVPLPLISAGNSNVMLTLTCVGLLECILLHRRQLLFS